jgi:hypothetical protein
MSDVPPRRPGRPLKGDAPTTSTDRNISRLNRLAATEVMAANTIDRLWKLYGELVSAGVPQRAADVRRIVQKHALGAAAEYTRRSAKFFVRNGPSLLSADQNEQRQREILRLADEIDRLDLDQVGETVWSNFEDVTTRLRGLGFFIDGALVSDVARATLSTPAGGR